MATEMGGGVVHLSTSGNVSPCNEVSNSRPQQLMDSIHPLEPHGSCELSFSLSLAEFGTVEIAPRISVAIQHPLHKAAPSSTKEKPVVTKKLQRKMSTVKPQNSKLLSAPIKSADEFSVQDYWPDLYMEPYVINAIEFIEPFVISNILFSALVWPRLEYITVYQIIVREKTSSSRILELMEKINIYNIFKTERGAAYSFLSWFDDVFCFTLQWPEDIDTNEDAEEIVLDMELRSSGAKALWEFDAGINDFVSTTFGGKTYINKLN